MSDRAEQAKALIEKRLAAATPGPWEAGDVWVFTPPIYPDDRRLSNVLGMDFADPERAAAERARGMRNADFIANAPADIAFLLAALTASEAEVTRLETGIAEALAQAKIMGTSFLAAPDMVRILERLSQPTTDTNGATDA